MSHVDPGTPPLRPPGSSQTPETSYRGLLHPPRDAQGPPNAPPLPAMRCPRPRGRARQLRSAFCGSPPQIAGSRPASPSFLRGRDPPEGGGWEGRSQREGGMGGGARGYGDPQENPPWAPSGPSAHVLHLSAPLPPHRSQCPQNPSQCPRIHARSGSCAPLFIPVPPFLIPEPPPPPPPPSTQTGPRAPSPAPSMCLSMVCARTAVPLSLSCVPNTDAGRGQG